ncbi:MAG: T9SS type A sorting domain-containing protein [Bacteroidetes bacterium]|nr:T9SS type A sorting domain-containing protein [Bacteroidota bacterium]
MKRCITALTITIFILAIHFQAAGQYTNVMISNQDWPNETSIYMNPKNTNQLVAGANLTAAYYSNDGGYTWGNSKMQSTLGVYGDPVLVIDTNGYFYYFHLSNPVNNPGGWLDQIVCQRSTNSGLSWNDGSGIGKNSPAQQDKPWVIVNPYNNELYVTWTQFDLYGVSDTTKHSNIHFSSSSDNGISWTPAIRLNEISGNCVDSDSTVEGAVPAVGPEGEIYTSWAGPAGIVFDRSLDGGITWLDHDITVSDMPGGWDFQVPGIFRVNGMPVTCCDLSKGPHNGTIYINWSDQRNGTFDTDIWLSKSTDGGNTWSPPLRVNNDPPGKQQFFNWMTIDQSTGYIWIVFYDRRNYNDNRTDVFLACSTDGGNTFSNFKVSETPFLPSQTVFFGDYTCITAHNNKIRPIWTRLDDLDLSIYTAIVDTLLLSSQVEEAIPFAVEQNYPNPFHESTIFSFKLRNSGNITLTVNDIFGKTVALIIDNKWMERGKYVKSFNPAVQNLPSGVYYFSLKGNGINRQRKMIYQK